MQLKLGASLLAVLLVAAAVRTSEAASCSTKKMYWGQSGHNEDCKATCYRYGKRKPLQTNETLICADFDGEDFDNPLPTDWVAGSFRDIIKDPSSPQKQCWIHRHYFDPADMGSEMDNPIASSSNFYCGCWKESKACSKYKPKWTPHVAVTGKLLSETTCSDVCVAKGMVVVDKVPMSYNYMCRLKSNPAVVGWEHYEGLAGMMMCHFVQYDPVNDDTFNAKNEVYDCLCQKK